MTSSQFTLICMEGIKCAIAIWVGFILCKISIALDKANTPSPAKGTQLKYIKGHFRWLTGLTVVGFLLALLLFWGLKEIIEFKGNYKRLWMWKPKVETEIRKLGGKI